MTAEDGLIASISSLHLQTQFHHHPAQANSSQQQPLQNTHQPLPHPQMSQFGVSQPQQQNHNTPLPQPGAWYYEMGSVASRGSGGSSGGSDNGDPLNDFSDSDSFNLHNLAVAGHHAILSNQRNVTESVDVPSSEHVAEIVGRQGWFLVLKILPQTLTKFPSSSSSCICTRFSPRPLTMRSSSDHRSQCVFPDERQNRLTKNRAPHFSPLLHTRKL
ncbi:hypothetical protein L596_027396 [Steinernema carpocapsae]|uniref:Uncharacterized protein n=1 Tax=Steinernema carpocapsae TaxID=34508 RepID=A0A4V5ZYG5_STECR|nr:hypothetical protein L596_027396 [Steinernema carpocapsae]